MVDEEAVGLDKLVHIHAKIKAKILTFDAQIAELEEHRTEVRMAIKDQMRALGLTSLNTPHGRVALVQKTRYHTNDWDSFKKFVLEHEVVELLEQRISQKQHRDIP